MPRFRNEKCHDPKPIQLAGSRRKAVLAALNENGPLSVSLLRQVVRPEMSLRSVQQVVKRLAGKSLITAHHESSNWAGGKFYRFSHEPSARAGIAKWLGISPEELMPPQFFSRELNHSVQCAEWAIYLRGAFPKAIILRDQQELREQFFNPPSSIGHPGHANAPSFALSFEGKAALDRVAIGFEIENSRRVDHRLATWVRRIVQHSGLDGLVYICQTGGIRDALQALLDERKMFFHSRLRHYPFQFLLLADFSFVRQRPLPTLVSLEGKCIALADWISWLRKRSEAERETLGGGKPRFAAPRANANEDYG